MDSNTTEISRDLCGPDETEAFAAAIAVGLAPGDRMSLHGDLGAGKTTFVRGIARGLGHPDPREVASPTFAIHNRYEGARLTLDHIDAYRLKAPADLVREGLELILEDETNVLCCEWPERLAPGTWRPHVEITLEVLDDSRRRITCRAAERVASRLFRGMSGG